MGLIFKPLRPKTNKPTLNQAIQERNDALSAAYDFQNQNTIQPNKTKKKGKK